MVTYSTVAIITDVGLQAALNAEAVSGPRININSFQIGLMQATFLYLLTLAYPLLFLP